MWKKPLAAHDAPLKESPAETSKTDDKQASSVGSISENKSQAKENLTTALRTQLDKVFGQGWFARLMATGKFVIISRAEAKALGANPNSQAFYSPEGNSATGLKKDTTYFVADNIDTRTNLAKLMLHEIGVHALQMGKDNAAFKAILQQVKNLTEQKHPSAAVRAAIKAATDANTPADLFLEEVAGYLVEHHADLNVSQKIIAWFKSAVRAIGKALPPLERQKFFQWANNLNEADIITMASAALKNAPDSLLFDGDVRGGIRNSKGQLDAQNEAGKITAKLASSSFNNLNGKLLAPNGKPSNLNALQHAQVRTPEFKAWFGDWEQSLQPPVSIIELSGNEIQGSTPVEARKDAKAFIDKLIKTLIEETGTDTLHNERTGFDIRLTQKGVVHGFQHHGATHVKAVAGIKALIENAAKIAELPHEPTNDNFKSVLTFVAPLKLGNTLFAVKLTVKQTWDGKMRLYDHQALEMKKLDGISESTPDKSSSIHQPASSSSISVEQMLTAFNGDNQKYLASKVVDKNGEPLVVYHGTTGDFNAFDINKSGEASDTGMWGKGFYFTDDKMYAESYSKRNGIVGSMMPVFLSIKSPRLINSKSDIPEIDVPHLTMDDLKNADKNYSKAFTDLLVSNGNDGVMGDYVTEYIAFNPNQIKSATGNTGAFSKDNNDIRYSFSSTATDYFTGKPRRTTTLDDMDTMIDTFRQPKDTVGWQWYFDKVVTNFTDSTRPFERFVMDTFDSVQASKLLSGANRALGMKASYEKEAMNLFGRHIADGIRDIMKHVKPSIKGFVSNSELYKTAKDMTGYWMTAKYSIDANNWLMEKDQQAIDDLEQEKLDTQAKLAASTRSAQSVIDRLNKELIAIDKQLVKAKDTQAKRIAAINDPAIIDPTKQKQEAGLAGGFNHETAKATMAKIEAKIPLALLDKTANHVYDMNQWKLKRDIEDDKISQATADKFPKYRHYVPLTGDPRVDDSVEDHFATGSVNQASDKAIGGRTGSIAQNGIDASFEQLEKSARYHGWNEFKEALTDTYNKLIADKVASGMKQKQAEQAVFDEFDIKRRPEAGMIPAGENDITVRKDGKGFIYTINNQGAMEALRSVNNEDIPSILKPIAFFTRFQARMVTQFMPLFAPTNMIRDVAERSENIRTRKIAGYPDLDMNKVANQAIGHAVKLLTQLRPVMMGVLAENTHLAKLFPVDNTNPDVIMLKRFLALGGSSTYGDMLSGDSKSLAEKLRKTGTFSDKAMEVIELWNNGFETISGFSIYKSLVDNGVSDKDAATASLNLMNFGKRGRVMSPLRALYMFANPIAQGGQQLAMTLGTRRGQIRYAVYTIAAMALYAMLRSGDDDDELGTNRMDEAGNFNLYRNILIPMGDGQYFKVPIGFGMQQLAWAHGVNAVRTLLGEMTAGEAIAESAGLWARSAMPVAPAETSMMKNPMVWFAQTFSPQVAKPIVNIAMDVNSFGAPLTNARYERQDKAKAL